jgi:hypothetical protein
VKLGSIYEHYKGKRYILIGMGKLESTGEVMAIYREFTHTSEWETWIRPAAEFKKKFTLVEKTEKKP